MSTTSSLVPYTSLAEIEQFIAAFENLTLSRAEWTHRAHLTMAAWYVAHLPLAAATERIRAGVQKLNAAVGVVSDADRGYHETITLFYVGTVADHFARAGDGTFLEAVNSLFVARGALDLPLKYYSREYLYSREARARWMPPDLRPFEWSNQPTS